MKLALYTTTILVMLAIGEAQAPVPAPKIAKEETQVLYCWIKVRDQSSGLEYHQLLRTSLMKVEGVTEVKCDYDTPKLLRAVITLLSPNSADRTKKTWLDDIRLAVERVGLKVVHMGDTPQFPLYKRVWVWGVAVAVAGAAVAILTRTEEQHPGMAHPGTEH